MTRTEGRLVREWFDHDMHYHCEGSCGKTYAHPGLCHTPGCTARGEDTVRCRKPDCAPEE